MAYSHFFMRPSLRTTLSPLILFLTAWGCGSQGPKTYMVGGTVNYAGDPMPAGTVMFVPDVGGGYASGNISAAGSYQMQVPAGTYKIAVSGVSFPNGVTQEAVPLLPSKYGSEQSSGLTAEVKPQASNRVDLELPNDPKFQRPRKK